jgi:hypothetical protein
VLDAYPQLTEDDIQAAITHAADVANVARFIALLLRREQKPDNSCAT